MKENGNEKGKGRIMRSGMGEKEEGGYEKGKCDRCTDGEHSLFTFVFTSVPGGA